MNTIDLSLLSFEELIELKEKASSLLYNYTDGYLYICEVRSYGNFRTETPLNTYSLSLILQDYDGYDGIVDLYTNNPSLDVYNYGDTFYISSKQDYASWKEYSLLKRNLEDIKKDLLSQSTENKRSLFGPIFNESDLVEAEYRLAHFNKDFISPVLYCDRPSV
jgi:hypothetical protein